MGESQSQNRHASKLIVEFGVKVGSKLRYVGRTNRQPRENSRIVVHRRSAEK